MTRPNSVEIGGRDSRTTSSIAWRNEEPARSALAIRVIVSGSCLLKALRRPLLRRLSQKRGSRKPISAPMTRKIGLPRAGSTTESASMMSGTPSVVPAQIIRYSLGLSLRSARAISRARLAPKSRCSTTLLSWASAWLDCSAAPRPPSPVGRGDRLVRLVGRVALEPRVDAGRRRPDIAIPTAISRIARAATPAIRRVMVSTAAASPIR